MPVSDPLALPVDAGVLIAIAAAMENWDFLDALERPIIVTPTVWNEIRRGPPGSPGAETPTPRCMRVWPDDVSIPAWLLSVLAEGEASVIALALERGWPEVAIDEKAGRSVARTCHLRLTGSLGLLIAAKRRGWPLRMSEAIARIRAANIWLGALVEQAALHAAGEI